MVAHVCTQENSQKAELLSRNNESVQAHCASIISAMCAKVMFSCEEMHHSQTARWVRISGFNLLCQPSWIEVSAIKPVQLVISCALWMYTILVFWRLIPIGTLYVQLYDVCSRHCLGDGLVVFQLRHVESEKCLGAPFVHLASRVFNDSPWLSLFFSILKGTLYTVRIQCMINTLQKIQRKTTTVNFSSIFPLEDYFHTQLEVS